MQQQRSHRAGFGGELQPAARGQANRAGFAEHGDKVATPKRFLHCPKRFAVPPRPDDDETRRIQPEADKAGAVYLADVDDPRPEAPQHHAGTLTHEPGEEGGREGGGRTRRGIPGEDLVQRGRRNPAVGQPCIDLGNAEGNATERRPRAALDGPDAGPQPVEPIARKAPGTGGNRRRTVAVGGHDNPKQ